MNLGLRAVFAVLILGVVATVATGHVVDDRRNGLIQQDLETRALLIADESADRLTAALATSESFAGTTNSAWPSPQEYAALWDVSRGTLPGDALANLIVAVAPEQLDSVVAEEQLSNPAFTLVILNDNPSGPHLLTLRGTTDDIPVGVDISSVAAVSSSLLAIAPDESTYSGFDIRSGAGVVPGQLQVISRGVTQAGGTTARDTWTTVQIDVAAIFEDVLASAGTPYGARLSVSANPKPTMHGLPQADTAATTELSRPAGPIEVSAVVWTDGSAVTSLAPQSIYALGGMLTLLVSALMAATVAATTLRRRVDDSDRIAREDPLTGLHNRRWLQEHIEEMAGQPLAVLYCDLDRFKVVNDSAGHGVGDELLVQVSERLTTALGDHGELARFGGDEFVVVCDATDRSPDEAGAIAAELLVEAMAKPFSLTSGDLRASMSIGVATAATGNEIAGTELIRAADVALGHSKTAGRGGWVLYDDTFREADHDRLLLEADLQRALDRSDLVVHYQPIVDSDGRSVSFESLVRWDRSGDGLIPPHVFLPVVAEIGRMGDLGEIVLRRAIADFVTATEHQPTTTLHVNVDPSQLTDRSFPTLVQQLLVEHKLESHRLILELVENEWFDLAEQINPVLGRLADLGVGLAIDDFGSGYSSMARILDVDGLVEIKIDRSIASRATDPRTEALIAGLADTARRLDVSLVAEGVETQEELTALIAAGVTRFQGYFFARPAPSITFEPDTAQRLQPV